MDAGQRHARRSLAICAALVVACESAPTDVGQLRTGVGGPMPFLNAKQQALFDRGFAGFNRVYAPATGLGPLFNGKSCVECHDQPAPGGAGFQVGVRATAFRGGECNDLSDVGGPVIQEHVTPALHDALGIDAEPIPPQATGIGLRTTPALWGSGLLDAVPDSEILALADPTDRDGDGVAGRPSWTADGRLGRFGRKAQIATLWDFMGGAYMMEVGISNDLDPVEQTVGGQPLPPGVEAGPDTEIKRPDLNDADGFVRMLAPPAFAGPPGLFAQGRAIFASVGCAACHVPELRTHGHPVISMSHQVFSPYTDLLLHNMGPGLADICMGQALPEEFRTEPLWGVRLRVQFLHDGRAKTIDAAIQLHGGEGSGARQRYLALSDEERAILLRFLGSL